MLELTRKSHTEGFVELRVVVPETQADAVVQALEWISEPTVPMEEVFPASTAGSRLRGARGLREMTQARLAELIGVNAPNISAMENGKRPIGKVMAKKLGEALGFSYRVFL